MYFTLKCKDPALTLYFDVLCDSMSIKVSLGQRTCLIFTAIFGHNRRPEEHLTW